MNGDELPCFTPLGLAALWVMKRLTEYREREHREGSQQRPEEHDAEKQKCSDRENIRSELHLRSPI
jgi:hypothetical protein